MVIIFLWPPRPQCNIDPYIFCAVLLFANIQAQRCNIGCGLCFSLSPMLVRAGTTEDEARPHHLWGVWDTSAPVVSEFWRNEIRPERAALPRSWRIRQVWDTQRGVGKRMWACDWTSECGWESGERGSACTHSPSVNKRVWAQGCESPTEREWGGGDLQRLVCSNMASSRIQHALRALWAPCTDQSQIS